MIFDAKLWPFGINGFESASATAASNFYGSNLYLSRTVPLRLRISFQRQGKTVSSIQILMEHTEKEKYNKQAKETPLAVSCITK